MEPINVLKNTLHSIPEDLRAEYFQEVLFIYFNRFRIFSVFCLIVFILLLIFFDFLNVFKLPPGPLHTTFTGLHIVAIIVFSGFLLLDQLKKPDSSRDFQPHHKNGLLVVFTFSVVAVYIFFFIFLMQRGTPLIYFIGLMFLIVGFPWIDKFPLLPFLLTYLCFFVSNFFYLKAESVIEINTMGFVATSLAYIFARTVTELRVQNFLDHQTIQRQTQELNQKVVELSAAHRDVAEKNVKLDHQIQEVKRMNQELVASQQQANRIFSALAEALPGTILDGKYRLDEKIGAGGFGVVFRGTHLLLNRPIAIKVFRPPPGNDSAEAVERFRLEGVSTSRINHPNAVAVLDSGISTEGIAYLVMELLQGHSLADELKQTPTRSLQTCIQWMIPVCHVLAEAHRVGIIHRDIKPPNIFLHRTKEGEIVKVVDFGIAKLSAEDTGDKINQLTATGSFIGTLTYMAPERMSPQPYDGKVDVYSVGVMMYELVCGKVPFPLTAGGVYGVIMKHLNEIPRPPREITPNIPVELETLIMQTLDKDPEKRPTADELAVALTELASQLPETTFELTTPKKPEISLGEQDTLTI
ncbi:MAG TPA: serine/threonine-protein kinase [Acidobacteriota bacterium]|nr:serine/threonine-protein kinase [Acidobacteriota bacterium]